MENPRGFPLTGFLKVEMVPFPGAEVTFRPGETRAAVLTKERAELAAVEKKVLPDTFYFSKTK